MKKLPKLLLFFITGIILFTVIILSIPDQYSEIYQRSIVYQYDYLRSIDDEKKLILIGNSSLMFGLDLDTMDELSGYRSVILGGHAGYGLPFFMEMSKSSLRAGDVVVIEFPGKTDLDAFDVDLLLTGIGKRSDMYRFFVGKERRYAMLRYPKYIKDSFNYMLNGGYHSGGVYSMEAMDHRGSMVYERGDCDIPYPYSDAVAAEDQYQWFEIKGFEPDRQYCDYVNEYVEYCSERNVQVLFTVPCYLDEAVISNADDMDAYDASWAKALNAPYVSKQTDYIFPREYIYNQAAHCNSKGAVLRTTLLYNDIKEFL